MTSPKFAVGDRVRIYGCSTQSMTNTGTITEWIHGVPMVKHDMSSISQTYHPKQLRRLKPKPKPKPKAEVRGPMCVYLTDYQMTLFEASCNQMVCAKEKDNKYTHEFREVTPGSVSVMREDLVRGLAEAGLGISTNYMDKLCKALGLGEA